MDPFDNERFGLIVEAVEREVLEGMERFRTFDYCFLSAENLHNLQGVRKLMTQNGMVEFMKSPDGNSYMMDLNSARMAGYKTYYLMDKKALIHIGALKQFEI